MRGLPTDDEEPTATGPEGEIAAPLRRPSRRPVYRFARWALAISGWLLLAVVLVATAMTSRVSPPAAGVPHSLRVASLNIRYDPSPDRELPPSPPGSERPWHERRQVIVDQVHYERPDILGAQEVLDHQLRDLTAMLPEYDHIGVGRDDGVRAGEAVPIFWRRDRFARTGPPRHFWLSKTPEVPGSRNWDASQTRMATVVHLQSLAQTGGASTMGVHVVNTHFDDRGTVSRAKASAIILDELDDVFATGDLVLLTGDLNSETDEDGYRVLTNFRYATSQPERDRIAFLDTHEEVASASARRRSEPQLPFPRPHQPIGVPAVHGVYGYNSTFTDFASGDKPEKDKIIDFVMLADNQAGWNVRQAAVLPNLFPGHPRLSDHRMVLSVLEKDG